MIGMGGGRESGNSLLSVRLDDDKHDGTVKVLQNSPLTVLYLIKNFPFREQGQIARI